MRKLLLPMFAMAAVLLLGASDPERTSAPPASPKPPKPTGHVLFYDTFDDPSLHGWKADKAGVWSVRRGVVRADLPDQRQQHSFLYAGSADWTDYDVELDVCAMRGVDKGLVVRVLEGVNGIGVDLRGPGYQDVVLQRREWPMSKARALNANAMWHHLRVELREHRYRVFVNGALLIDKTDAKKARTNGGIALAAYTGGVGQCTIYYDNVLVTAPGSATRGNANVIDGR